MIKKIKPWEKFSDSTLFGYKKATVIKMYRALQRKAYEQEVLIEALTAFIPGESEKTIEDIEKIRKDIEDSFRERCGNDRERSDYLCDEPYM